MTVKLLEEYIHLHKGFVLTHGSVLEVMGGKMDFSMLFPQFFRERTFKAKGSEKRREMINGGYLP